MTNNKTILITGVTGNQGGVVARALLGRGFHLHGLTRKPDSEPAVALARHGVDIIKGDLDDEATLRLALACSRRTQHHQRKGLRLHFGAIHISRARWSPQIRPMEKSQDKGSDRARRKVLQQEFVFANF